MIMKHHINELFIKLQHNALQHSKDPTTKVGAFLIDAHYNILAEGYNNFPNHNHQYSWNASSKDISATKYPYVVHAETNLIVDFIYYRQHQFHKFKKLIMLVNLLPCNECAKLIISLPISKVYYLEGRQAWQTSVTTLFKNQRIPLIKFKLNHLT